MTRAKFKRLFIVLIGPLLIAGGILSTLANEDPSSIHLRCGIDYCNNTGDGELDKQVASGSPQWFDVYSRSYEDNSFPRVYSSASQRLINNAEIIDATPYSGTADGPGSPLDQLRSMAGQKISILFGTPNEPRPLDPLGCNQLDFEKASSGVFIAGLCGIPNGVARVEFRVDEQTQQDLMALKAAIDDQTSSGRQVLISNYLFLTPLFVVLFLIISGMVWIIRRAISYVAAA